MRCPFCSHEDTKVIDSRLVAEGGQVRRRRECFQCSERFTTYETAELLMPRIIKSNGPVSYTHLQCRADQIVVNNTCACPSGKIEISGTCQVPVQCRADQVVVNNNCACPAGQTEVGGVCQAPVVTTETYKMTGAAYNNVFGAGNYSYSGTFTLNLTNNAFTSNGVVTLGSTGVAGFSYSGNWATAVGGSAVTKTGETCTNSGFVPACTGVQGNYVGNADYPVTIVKSGNTIVITRNIESPEGVDTFTFTKQ